MTLGFDTTQPRYFSNKTGQDRAFQILQIHKYYIIISSASRDDGASTYVFIYNFHK